MFEVERFRSVKNSLVTEFRQGKRWIVLEETDVPENRVRCYRAFNEAEAAGKPVAELVSLLRLLNPQPKHPYQLGGAVPVTISKVIHPLTGIDRYCIKHEQKGRTIQFSSFNEACLAFNSGDIVKCNRRLAGIWKDHPSGQKEIELYCSQIIQNEIIIQTLHDPCESIEVPLTFFVKQHMRTGDMQYFDCQLRRVKRIDSGRYCDTSRYIQLD